MKTMKIQRSNNEEEKKDRFSDLSDCVLLHILSILSSKEAVQTCILSKRWKNLWRQLSILSFNSSLSCHNLTSLNLCANIAIDRELPIFPNSLNLPALTNLSLNGFAFCGGGNDGRAEPFSSFNNLNTLTIHSFEVLNKQNLFISSATLVNLTIETFDDDYCKIELSTPCLSNFDFKGKPVQKLSGSDRNLSSIKHVSIDVPIWSMFDENYPAVLLNWLVELVNMESLTVSLHILQILDSIIRLGKVDFPYLHNLKSLTVKTHHPRSVHGIVNSLLQKTPSAEYKIIDL